MSEQEIIKDNKLIANFYNLQVIGNEIDVPFRPNLQCFRENELKYHSSWDWLIPVVEKIQSVNNEIKGKNYKDYSQKTIIEGLLTINIDIVYKGVVEFIKWYNLCQKEKQ